MRTDTDTLKHLLPQDLALASDLIELAIIVVSLVVVLFLSYLFKSQTKKKD